MLPPFHDTVSTIAGFYFCADTIANSMLMANIQRTPSTFNDHNKRRSADYAPQYTCLINTVVVRLFMASARQVRWGFGVGVRTGVRAYMDERLLACPCSILLFNADTLICKFRVCFLPLMAGTEWSR